MYIYNYIYIYISSIIYIYIFVCMSSASKVYGDTAQFSKEGDKFTALCLGFPLHRGKGGDRVMNIRVHVHVPVVFVVPGLAGEYLAR